MNVSLTPELEEYIRRKLASGRYTSASEVVREALRLLQERDELYQAKLEELKRELAIGAEQIAAGQSEVFDREAAERIKAELRRRAKGKKKRA